MTKPIAHQILQSLIEAHESAPNGAWFYAHFKGKLPELKQALKGMETSTNEICS